MMTFYVLDIILD